MFYIEINILFLLCSNNWVLSDFFEVFFLSLCVFLLFQGVDYDKEGSILRVRGKNILENEHVKVVS
jgi:hypothetical protein